METCADPIKTRIHPQKKRRTAPWFLGAGLCLLFTVGTPARAQEFATPPGGRSGAPDRITVTADGLPSAYGAPQAFSRTRTSATTTSYVLPPWTVYTGLDYELDSPRQGRPTHLFTQELEMGLPYRFGVAVENNVEAFHGDVQESTFSVEGRYALANWNKLPLNPTLFAEYKFGLGHLNEGGGEGGGALGEMPGGGEMNKLRQQGRHNARALGHPRKGSAVRREEGDAGEDVGESEAEMGIPDFYELRLLLAQDFGDRLEYAMNIFFEQETSGDRGREIGFSQSLAVPVFGGGAPPAPTAAGKDGKDRGRTVAAGANADRERLKVGVEMQFRNSTVAGARGDGENTFVIGPSLSFKPTPRTRLDVAPLFGVTHDSPRVQAFVVLSAVFGRGGEGGEAEAPISTRNR